MLPSFVKMAAPTEAALTETKLAFQTYSEP